MIDPIDQILLENIAQNPGQPVYKSFQGAKWRSKKAFYNRVYKLEFDGLVSIDRSPMKFNFATITERGLSALTEAKA